MTRNLCTHLSLAALLSVATTASASAAQFGAPRPIPGTAQLVVNADGTYRAFGNGARLTRTADGTWSKTTIPFATLLTGIAQNRRGDVVAVGEFGPAGPGFVVTSASAAGVVRNDALTPQPDEVGGRRVGLPAIGDNGDAFVAWVTADRLQVVARSGADGPWNQPLTLGAPGARPLALAVNDAGSAVLAWSEPDGGAHVMKSARISDPSGAWSAPTALGSPSPRTLPRRIDLDLDATGRASALWVEDGLVLSSTSDSSTVAWSGPESFGIGFNASLDVSDSGHSIAAWTAPSGLDGPTWRVLVRRRPAGSTTWAAHEQVSDASLEAFEPHVSIADDGAAIAAWWRHPKPLTFRWAPVTQATVAAAGSPFDPGRDIASLIRVDCFNEVTTAILDADHAGVGWSTCDGGGAGTTYLFSEYAPTAVPAPTARLRVSLLSGPNSASAGSIVHLVAETNRNVERLSAAVLEQQVAGRWILVRRLPSSTQVIPVRLGAIGLHLYRIRLIGAGPGNVATTTVKATRPRQRVGVPCLAPLAATGKGDGAWVACEREHNASVFLRRLDPRTGAGRGPEITVGTNNFLDFWSGSFAHDSRRLWILRDTTLASIDRRSGGRFPDVRILDVGLGQGRLLAAGPAGVAIFEPNTGRLVRLSGDGVITARLELPVDPETNDTRLAVGPGGIWIAERTFAGTWSHTRIDSANQVTKVAAHGPVAGGQLGVWELRPGRVRRIDPPGSALPRTLGSNRPYDLEVGPDALWTIESQRQGQMRVARVNPRSGRVTKRWTLTAFSPLLPLAGRAWAVTDSGLIELR